MTVIAASQLTDLRVLRTGGFGAVLCGRLHGTPSGGPPAEVALKVLLDSENKQAKRRFLQEIALQSTFGHRHVVRVLATCQLPVDQVQRLLDEHARARPAQPGAAPPVLRAPRGGSVLASVQELCGGGSLADVISQQQAQLRSGGPMVYDQQDALRWLLGLAQALSHLHTSRPRLIHRDVKPDNVLLCKSEAEGQLEAKLGDLGLTSVVDETTGKLDLCSSTEAGPKLAGQRTPRSSVTSPRTQGTDEFTFQLTGKVGSLLHIAPEVLCCQPYNQAADVFSFGLTAWELLASCPLGSQLPATVDNYLGRAYAMAHEGWRPAIPATLPQRLQQLLAECWHEDWRRRPSAGELVCDLQALAADHSAAAAVASTSDGGSAAAATKACDLRAHRADNSRAGEGGAAAGGAPDAAGDSKRRVFGQEAAWTPPGLDLLQQIGNMFTSMSLAPPPPGQAKAGKVHRGWGYSVHDRDV